MNPLLAPELREMLAEKDAEGMKVFLENLHPATAAEFLSGLRPEEIAQGLQYASREQAAAVFQYLDIETQKELLEGLGRQQMARLLEEMSPDNRADLVKRLPAELVESVLPLVARAEREDIRRLATYEEGTAGAIMTTDYAALAEDITVGEAMERLRGVAPDKETVYYIYVINGERKLKGFLSLKALILARPATKKVADVMETDVISVHTEDDQEEVAKLIAKYDFIAIPVVDGENRLVGIVTVDDALDVVEEEAEEDILSLGAAGKPFDYMRASVFEIARKRILWLGVLVFAGFVSGLVLENFQARLSATVALAFFIPVLCGSGGNAGTQAATTIIRGLATGEIDIALAYRVIIKEALIGFAVGAAMAVLVAARALVQKRDLVLATTVGLAMLGTVVVAKVLGAVLPLFFKRVKLDPALMSGPFISSVLDSFTLLLYMSLAQVLYSSRLL